MAPTGKRTDRTTKSARAGVLFSVARFHRYLKKSTPKSRVTMAAAVYTAAVVRDYSFDSSSHLMSIGILGRIFNR